MYKVNVCHDIGIKLQNVVSYTLLICNMFSLRLLIRFSILKTASGGQCHLIFIFSDMIMIDDMEFWWYFDDKRAFPKARICHAALFYPSAALTKW